MTDDRLMLVDDREGSRQFAKLLRPSELGRLPFGDVSFLGNGPNGRPVPIGIELKQLSDVLSCITTGRFSGHQLPGLHSSYEYIYLVYYGIYSLDQRTGSLTVPRPRPGDKKGWVNASIGSRAFMYREFESWLATMELRGGVRIRRAATVREAAAVVQSLFSWWGKDWEGHHSHLALQEDPPWGLLRKPNLLRKMAAQLPGVGWTRSAAVASHFDSVLEMVNAGEKEWRQIEGIGKKTAATVIASLEGKSSA